MSAAAFTTSQNIHFVASGLVARQFDHRTDASKTRMKVVVVLVAKVV